MGAHCVTNVKTWRWRYVQSRYVKRVLRARLPFQVPLILVAKQEMFGDNQLTSTTVTIWVQEVQKWWHLWEAGLGYCDTCDAR